MESLLRKHLKERGTVVLSDAFIAILSGTTRNGNSLKAPNQALHSCGVIPKKMLPAGRSMTFDEYMNPARVTPEMRALGQEFLKRFPINYERAYLDDYPDIITAEPISVAGFGWPDPVNGVYPASAGPFNHCFLYLKRPAYRIFDNYRDDEVDNDFLKVLAPDYRLMEYGYRVYIGTSSVEYPESFISDRVLSWLKQLLRDNRGAEVLRYLAQRFGSIFTP